MYQRSDVIFLETGHDDVVISGRQNVAERYTSHGQYNIFINAMFRADFGTGRSSRYVTICITIHIYFIFVLSLAFASSILGEKDLRRTQYW